MADTPLLIENEGPVRRVTLARPNARNAQNREMLDALSTALERAREEKSVHVIILAGMGDHFSAGHDLKEAQRTRSNLSVEERWEYESKRYFNYSLQLWDFPKPTIAQVQGACIAGGFMLANMCDLLICSSDAFFSDPVAQTMAAAGTEVLVHPWVLGLRKAKELLFTGDRLSASEALRVGMANAVVPKETLAAEAMNVAQRIAKAPPFTLQLLKRSLNRTFDIQGFRSSLAAHFDTHELSHKTDAFDNVQRKGLATAIQRNK